MWNMLQVTFFPVEGKAKKFFGAFAGVHEEIKTFALDVANVVHAVSILCVSGIFQEEPGGFPTCKLSDLEG